ncbi:unnamed protein product [Alternaria alternata]
MSKSCVICGTEESEGELLLEAPCGRHWVCPDDVGSFFENATNNESLFPPQCCETMFMLEDYEDYTSFEIAWAYQMKQQGEYSILAKFRVYCANPACGKFLHPESHVEDQETKITYAICDSEECGKLTCAKCKALLVDGTQNHECKQTEDEKKFRQTANEKGYQECFVCGATVELAEACNHITCECGSSFCYICGKDWPGLHGCPHYGPAVYDEEGYNQDGYHRESGLNRQGLTRRQDMIRRREEDEEDDDEEGEGEDDQDEDPEWEVLQHLTPDQRALVNQLPHGPREDALDQFRITLFETQGITFDQFAHPPPPPLQEDFGDDGDAWEDDDDEGPENDQHDNRELAGGLPNEIDGEVPIIANEAVQIGTIDGAELDDGAVPVVHHFDDESHANFLENQQGDRADIKEEGIQEDTLTDDQSGVSGFDTATPSAHRNGERTDQRAEPVLAANSFSQDQQVPGSRTVPLITGIDTDTRRPPASFSTDGPHTIVARGFISATTIEDVETIMRPHSDHDILRRTVRSSDPLVVELQFAMKDDAERVIAAFHAQKGDGQVLDVRFEDEDL